MALNSLFKYNQIPSQRHGNARISECPGEAETGVIIPASNASSD